MGATVRLHRMRGRPVREREHGKLGDGKLEVGVVALGVPIDGVGLVRNVAEAGGNVLDEAQVNVVASEAPPVAVLLAHDGVGRSPFRAFREGLVHEHEVGDGRNDVVDGTAGVQVAVPGVTNVEGRVSAAVQTGVQAEQKERIEGRERRKERGMEREREREGERGREGKREEKRG